MRAGRPAAAMKLLKALFLLFVCPARAIDNGLGLTPPRGWRSCKSPRELHYLTQNLLGPPPPQRNYADDRVAYSPSLGAAAGNLFHANISTAIMETQMAAVVDTSRKVNGKPTTLASLGFDWISYEHASLLRPAVDHLSRRSQGV